MTSIKNKLSTIFRNASPAVYIIAEIGINHEGSADRCAKLIRDSAIAGADAVKLQTVDASKSYARDTDSYEVFSKSALSKSETAKMFQLARDCGVEVFTTSGDLQTLNWVNKLNPSAHKISSGLLSCLPIVREVCKLGKPVILSTGMSNIAAIDRSVGIATQSSCDTALLQCTSLYPCPIDKINLRSINNLPERSDLPVGLSDHSLGIDVAPLAVAAGSRLLEKHITFDKNRPGFDHSISIETEEFAEMVTLVRQAERALGRADKSVDNMVLAQAHKYERRLAAACDLAVGHILSIDDLLFMRFPSDVEAIVSYEADIVVDKQINTPVLTGQPIKWQYLS